MKCPRYVDRHSGLKECKISCTANGRPTAYDETGISMTSDLDYNSYRIVDNYTGREISWDVNNDYENYNQNQNVFADPLIDDRDSSGCGGPSDQPGDDYGGCGGQPNDYPPDDCGGDCGGGCGSNNPPNDGGCGQISQDDYG